VKTYENNQSILGLIASFHRRLSDYYGELTGKAQRQRAKLFLDYLEGKERRFAEALERYEWKEAPQKIRDMWYQYVPSDERIAEIGNGKYSAGMSVEDVAELVYAFDDQLIGFLRKMADEADSEGLRDMFSALAAQEEQEKAEVRQSAVDIERL
jgi:hypothetical protein